MEEDDPPGVPEWVVTYGDMMSLLLTFFIMLVSMSELKDEGKNRAALNSMKEVFGPMDGTSGVPGRTFNHRSSNEFMSSKSESKKTGLEKGSIASAGGGGLQVGRGKTHGPGRRDRLTRQPRKGKGSA